jgi:HlyD family secretion protein
MKKITNLLSVIGLVFLQISLTNCQKKEAAPSEIEVSGIIEAVKTEIKAQAQGEIRQILVQEGQKVKKGDLFCLLDDEKLRIQLSQVKAGQDAAEARLRLAKMGTKKEMIAVAKNQEEIAAKQLELAQKDAERLAKLFSQGAVSQSLKEKADLALKAAQEQYKSAQENYRMAARGREKEEIEVVEAEIQGLKAQEQYLLRLLQDTEIRSPVDGILEIKHVEVGELALPGAILFSLIDLERTYVQAYVPEKYTGKVKLGSEVGVSCDSYPGKTYKGKVNYISDEAEFAPKNIQTKEERLKLVYMIKSYLENKAGELKPGMPVDVKIKIEG